MFTQTIQELYKFRSLLWVWSLREIRIRYKQSMLGGIWAILQPLSTMLIFTFVIRWISIDVRVLPWQILISHIIL
jgi:ABC-type polysaccharide/polyol phosphate export permease